MVLFIVQKVS